MADYTLSNFRNYAVFTDQTGSAIYDSGGATGSYNTGENYYFTIAPQSSTGSLIVTVESASFYTTDKIRIYDGVPTKGTTGSFSYAGSSTSSQLIGIVTGSFGTPKYFTASSGKAYVRFSGDVNGTAGSAAGFKLSWTGSGFSTVDSSSGVVYNKYGITFPTDATSGSWMTFAPGKFTSSATLSPNKDFIFGFWAKADLAQASAPSSPVIGIGTMNGGQGISIMRISSPSAGDNTMALYYYDASGSISSLTTRATDILGGGQFSLSTYPPQWNHYGFVIRKTNATTGGQFLAYKDGVLFSSSSITKSTNWASISTTYDTILGSYRDYTSGQIMSGSTTKAGWSGSLDDVFVATVATGSIPSVYTSFFSSLYNSGNWSDPNTVISNSFSSSLNPTVILNWRFEETGSILSTKDYGYYGNFHTASATGNIANSSVRLTSTSSGMSFTPYSTLSYSASAAPGVAQFTSASYTTVEDIGNYTIYAQRVSGSAGALTASFFSYNITANEGVNYTDPSSQLTWSDGETSQKSITIPILYDGVQTSTLSFGLSFSGDYTGYSVNSSTTINIQDRNRGVFNWQSTSLTAYETGSVANINITRTSGSYGNVKAFIEKSSSFGGGYISTTPLTIFEGETLKQYSISITDDLVDESNEIITFKITPVDEDYLYYPKTGSSGYLALTIIDNETGSITFSSGSAAIYENTASYYIGVERLYGGDQAETASITFAGSTYAISGSDYNVIYNSITQSSPFNITWADQDKTTRYITASIINDNILESNETITFGIASSSISSIGPSSSFVLTVYDYEITGSVRFITGSYSVLIPGTVNVQVERYNGQDVSASAVIDVSSSSTAVAGIDYANIFPYTVNWANQESGSKNITVSTLSSWGPSTTLNLKFTSLTNLSSGSILTASVAITSTTITQSANIYPNVNKDYTINDYANLSYQFTRRTQQVPFSLNLKGTGKIRKP